MRCDFRHQRAVGAVDFELFCQLGCEILNVHPEETSFDATVLDEAIHDPARQIRRHGEPDALIATAAA